MKMNPFEKITAARKQGAAEKEVASRNPGSMDPRGRGGPVFEDMKDLFAELGVSMGDERVAAVREGYERKLKQKVLALYNEHLQGKKGSPAHSRFEKEVEKSFLYGFDLYLKVYLRLDQEQAPDPHKSYYAKTGGGGRMRVVDERSKEEYVRGFLTKGNDIADVLPRDREEHNFEAIEDFEGYASKYQPVVEDSEDQSALAAYMFEKFRVYEHEYMAILGESLKRKVPYKHAIDMATYTYGLDAGLYDEMEPYGLTPEEINKYAILNRTKVHYTFDAYKELGGELNEKYPYRTKEGETHRWVRGPKMIQHLILKYPTTAKAGLEVVDREIEHLTKEYADVPQQILIELCVESPDTYEEHIREFAKKGHVLMEQYPVPESLAPGYSGEKNLFSFFQLEGAFMHRLHKVGDKTEKDIARILKEVDAIQQTLTDAAVMEGGYVSKGSQRRVLQSFLMKNASKEKIATRELKYLERQMEGNNVLYQEAEEMDPRFGHFYVDLGFGDSDAEVLENGKIVVDLITEQYGDVDGEMYLDDSVSTFYNYLDAGFPQDTESQNALKDAIVMAPYDTKEFYEETLKRGWPSEVTEIKRNAFEF